VSDPAWRLLQLVLLAWVGALVASCGTDPDDLSRCSPPLAITVIRPPLTFAWEPSDCDVLTLTVFQGNTVNIVWHIDAGPAGNSIKSPVLYGVAPDHVDASGADTLGVGPYTVEVTRLNATRTALEVSRQDFSLFSPVSPALARPGGR
jgi:hypothetical protein